MRGLLAALIAGAALIGCGERGGPETERAAARRSAVVGPLAATPIGKLLPAAPGSLSRFGSALAVDGDRIAAGVPSFDDFSPRLGAVFVFERNGGAILQTDLIGLDDRIGTELGSQVLLQGARMLAYEFGDAPLRRIAVYHRETAGRWLLEQRITLPVALSAGSASLALSNDTIVAGAPVAAGESDTGSADVFVKAAGGWSHQADIVPGTPSASFGQSVAVEGDLVAAGFAAISPGPSVWIFERSAGAFTEVARLSASDATARNRFGQTLAFSAGRLYVGAPNAEVGGPPSGAVYEFSKFEGAWIESAKLAPMSVAHGSEFGSAFAADWPWILIGAPLDTNAGAAYLFSTETGEWLEEVRISPALGQSHDEFGRALGLSGNLAAIGAPGADNFGAERGVVHAFAVGLELGQSCTTSADCAGFCVDGICCDRPCDGGCESCLAATGATGDGVCTPLPTGTEVAACFPILCNGDGVCPRNCTTAGCNAAFYCEATSGECRPRGAPGAVCSENVHCLSGVCDGGTCCDRECSGCSSCRSALTAYTNGLCAPVLAGTDPHLTCEADPGFPENCRADGRCDGGGQCRRFAPPTTACGSTSCIGDTISGKLCNGQGGCGDASASCTPNQCRDGLCGEACRDNRDCAGDARCSAGACVLKRPNASACRNDEECASGFCSDGVCCNSRCDAQCEYCRGEKTVGTCTAAVGAPPPGRPACTPSATDNRCTSARCDGRIRDSCVDACTEPAVCDGDHQLLVPGRPKLDCTPYRCDPAGACRSRCSSGLECVSGYRCNSKSECVRRDPLDDPGCACRSAGPSPLPPAGPAIFALGLLLLARRRRVGSPRRSSAAR